MLEKQCVSDVFGTCSLVVHDEASMMFHRCAEVPGVYRVVGPRLAVAWFLVGLDWVAYWGKVFFHEIEGSVDVGPC